MKTIKKACSGTSLYPKKSSVSSKLKAGGKIKKAQQGAVAKDKTSVAIPNRKPDTVRNQPEYRNIFGEKANLKTSKDTTDYKSGYNFGVEQKDNSPLYRGLSSNKAWNAGNEEGYYKKPSGKKLKSGGTVKSKDGKWIQSATASIKKRGTKGVCTGAKFGGPTCKPGTRRYSLAKTFKSIAKKKK